MPPPTVILLDTKSSSGQVYASDTHQLSTYLDDYHRDLDRRLGAAKQASEIITEIYVPRLRLPDFLAEVRADFRSNSVNLIYGTIRLIEQDTERFQSDWYRHYREMFADIYDR